MHDHLYIHLLDIPDPLMNAETDTDSSDDYDETNSGIDMDSIFHSTDKSVEHVHNNSALRNGNNIKKLSSLPSVTSNTTNLSQNLDKDKIFLHAKCRFSLFEFFTINLLSVRHRESILYWESRF